MTADQRIAHAIEQTEILRPPRQTLATFGATVVRYYVVTEPSYAGVLPSSTRDTVVREGAVTSQQPQVVTPQYMSNLEGFSEEAQRYFQMQGERNGWRAPGLMYAYRNDPRETSVVAGEPHEVAHRIMADLDRRSEHLSTVIKGLDELWDVSLLKFIYELTARSLVSNVQEMYHHGMLEMDSRGLPRDARERIERMFQEARRGNVDPATLKRELDQWDVFPEYEDRFYALFRRRR